MDMFQGKATHKGSVLKSYGEVLVHFLTYTLQLFIVFAFSVSFHFQYHSSIFDTATIFDIDLSLIVNVLGPLGVI